MAMIPKKVVYIAGALNSDAIGYIQNVHKMVKYSEQIRELGCSVIVPCNDFISGIISGDYEYKDYFSNNIEILKRCDAIALVPGWENSKGVNREIEVAVQHDIKVLEFYSDVMEYLSGDNKLHIE